MTTWDSVCEIVGSLPGTELDPDRQGRPTWRVDGRPILRQFPHVRVRNEEALLEAGGEVLAIGVEPGLREALLQQDPNTFFVTPMWAKRHAVLVWLESIASDELRELIIEVWQPRASKTRVLLRAASSALKDTPCHLNRPALPQSTARDYRATTSASTNSAAAAVAANVRTLFHIVHSGT